MCMEQPVVTFNQSYHQCTSTFVCVRVCVCVRACVHLWQDGKTNEGMNVRRKKQLNERRNVQRNARMMEEMNE